MIRLTGHSVVDRYFCNQTAENYEAAFRCLSQMIASNKANYLFAKSIAIYSYGGTVAIALGSIVYLRTPSKVSDDKKVILGAFLLSIFTIGLLAFLYMPFCELSTRKMTLFRNQLEIIHAGNLQRYGDLV